jgi:hypothetical protein
MLSAMMIQGRKLMLLLICLSALSVWGRAHATDVSGDINGIVAWDLPGSPYIVVDDLMVIGDLQVAPNVLIRVRPGKLITVTGKLRLQGNVITSTNDVVGSTVPAAKGDWGPLLLDGSASYQANGSVADSILNGTLRFGKGLRIIKSHPVLTGLRIENAQGAAIEQDLYSRPARAQVVGIGNDINAIVLPAGNQSGNVYLGLTGLPYLVNGRITFGPLPLSFEPELLSIQEGETYSLKLKLLDPAPAGGAQITLQASPNGIVTLPAAVTIPEAQSEVAFNIIGSSNGATDIFATLANVGTAKASVRVRALPALRLNPVASLPGGLPIGSLAIGRTHSLGLSVSQAQKAPLSVSLTSSAPALLSVPATVQFAAGVTDIRFNANAIALGKVTILASAPGFQPSSLDLSLREANLSWPDPLRVPLGQSIVQLLLSDPVPLGGASFNLTSSDSAVLALPATLTAPAGAYSLSVSALAGSEGTSVLTASSPGFRSATVTATVAKIELAYAPASARIPLDLDESFTVRLLSPAAQAGAAITLTSSSPNLTVTPSTFTLPANQSTAPQSFELKGTLEGNYTVTATGPGLASQSLPISVGPRASLQWNADQSTEIGIEMNSLRAGKILFDGQPYAARKRHQISFASSNPAAASAQANTLSSQSGFAVSTLGLAQGATNLTASHPNMISTAPLPQTVVKPVIRFSSLDTQRSLQSPRDQFETHIELPNGREVIPNVPQQVSLAIVDAVPSDIVPGIYPEPVGGAALSALSFAANAIPLRTAHIGVPTAIGQYRVAATLQGQEYRSDVQNVVRLRLRLSANTFIVGKGLKANTLKVERLIGDTLYSPSQALTVGINNVDTLRFSAPAQVTIPAGQASVEVPLLGLQTTTAPVELSAFSTGGVPYEPAPAAEITVVEPNLIFTGLSNPFVNGVRNRFKLRYEVPGATEPYQLSAIARVVTLAAVDQSPLGIIAGIYDVAEGGTLVTSIEIGASQPESPALYVGAATSVGSYRLRASVAGNANSPWLSALQSASAQTNVVRISIPESSVGLGLSQFGRVYLDNPPPAPVQVQLISNPPGAIEFVPSVITVGSTQADFIAIGRIIGASSAIANGPPGYGTDVRALTVEPFSASFGHSNTNLSHSLSFNGYLPATTAINAQITDNTPSGTVSIDCPAILAAGSNSMTCSTERTPGVLSTFRLQIGVGALSTVTSRRLSTDLIFDTDQLNAMRNTFFGQYVGLCANGSFQLAPSNLGTITVPASGGTCTVVIAAAQVGTGTVIASNSFGSVSIPITVRPLALETAFGSLLYIRTLDSSHVTNPVDLALTIEGDSGLTFSASGSNALNITIPAGDYRTDQIFTSPGTGGSQCRIKIDAGTYGIFYGPCDEAPTADKSVTSRNPAGEKP